MEYEEGADWSKWNEVDFVIIKEDGRVKFALVKISQALFTDSKAEIHKAGCISISLPWGGYHFFDPAYDPIKQADYFINAAGPDCKAFACDMEWYGPNVLEKVIIFLDRVKLITGIRPILYTSKGFWDAYCYPYPTLDCWKWAANYTTADNPALPNGWATWDLWQYTSTANIPGCDPGVDLNRVFSVEIKEQIFLLTPAPPPPEPVLPKKVKIAVNTCNVRNNPGTTAGVIGSSTLGKVWYPTAFAYDANGATWYKMGKRVFIAASVCSILE